MSHDGSLILAAIERLRCCSEVNILASWHRREAAGDEMRWGDAPLDAKGHIAWSSGRQVLWLAQKLIIPQHLQGYPLEGLSLRLALTWWAEAAQIFVNGVRVQEGDLFDCSVRVLLSSSVTPGEQFDVALRLVSPGHDDGALVRSLCLYDVETWHAASLHPGFVADELAVLQRYLDLAPEKLAMAAAVAEIDWSALPDRQKMQRSLLSLRNKLVASHSTFIKQRRIQLVGHAHLDLAWLWPVSETWDVAQRTFESVLKLQQDFPLTFCHSTPALYAWIEQHRPDLFAAIQQQVAAGRWEAVGGLWVEPELNLINGESIVRQLLYGQRYVLEKFGAVSTIAWLPDSFGFCATLPQILALGGIEYFVTQKLQWNDTTKFPHQVFWWQSPDGTKVFGLMSAPIGEGVDPVKMAAYACDWEKQTGLGESLWLPGVGDHGGGPTRDMLEVAQRWQQSPLFPCLEFSTAASYLEQLSTQHSELRTPTWTDELYLEFHRGCYTTHAEQKRWNRRCEGLLYQAELFASLATLSAGTPYPKAKLEAAWKQVLFNQFHDILPGSSIPQVYADANEAWQEAERVGTQILQQSLEAIASQIVCCLPHASGSGVSSPLPLLVFNSLNWQRSEVVSVALSGIPPHGQEWHVYDLSGQHVLSQVEEGATLLFLAADIPSVGYRLFWLCLEEVHTETEECSQLRRNQQPTLPTAMVLENELLRVSVDVKTGDLGSIFDKVHEREVLHEAGGNQLQAFQDRGQYWDAWNIDPNYTQHPLPPTQLKSIQWIGGPVQQRVRVVRQLGQSEFCQDYILQTGASVLKIATSVDWQERQTLVKVAFPLNLEADYATYEIPCGAIQRPTQPKTPEEQAKWEVPALRWADLTQNEYGVSLLNDSKYGYDCQPNQLRLTLLRSPNWPDPDADRGLHEFTYAIYPHGGSWQSAHTVRRGYELNLPLQVICPSIDASDKDASDNTLPAVGRLLDLSGENLIVMAFKQSEDDPHQWILRCYECHGDPGELSLRSDLPLSVAHTVDLLELSVPSPPSGERSFRIEPWKIVSFAVASADNQKSS